MSTHLELAQPARLLLPAAQSLPATVKRNIANGPQPHSAGAHRGPSAQAVVAPWDPSIASRGSQCVVRCTRPLADSGNTTYSPSTLSVRPSGALADAATMV